MNTIKHEAEVFKSYHASVEENFNGLYYVTLVKRGKEQNAFDGITYKTPQDAFRAVAKFLKNSP